jgi:hypothetical protein
MQQQCAAAAGRSQSYEDHDNKGRKSLRLQSEFPTDSDKGACVIRMRDQIVELRFNIWVNCTHF